MTELEIFNLIESGDFSALSQDELVAGAAFGLRISAKTNSVLAVVIARLRQEFIPDAGEWAEYCLTTFNLSGPYMHHLHKIGKMLSVTCDTRKVYTVLFSLDADKQLAIARIPADQIDTFIKLQTKTLAKMTRAEVRAAVSLFLGENHKEEKAELQPMLPGFAKWLDNVEAFEPAAVVSAVNNDDTATRSFSAGCLLLGAALDYHRRREIRDTALLVNLKAALLDEVQSIENILAQE